MTKLACILVASLIGTACEDRLASRTDEAAERATEASDQLRHERRELAAEVAERADDRSAGRDVTDHVGDVSAQVEDVSREAGELTAAAQDFEQLRALRIAALRAEVSVAESQPLLIQVIANEKPLTPVLRRRLDENLAIFRQRLAHVRERIESLQDVNATDWERRDDEVGRAMASMFVARDASWQIIDDTPERHEAFPET